MTREEAINILYGIQADNLNINDAYIKDKYEALDMAIKALEQEPCGDVISRQAVIDIIHRFFTEEVDKIPTKKAEDGEVYVIHKCQPLFEMNKAICKRIKALSSVSPTQNCVENVLDMRCEDAISRQAVLDGIEELKKSPWATDKRGNGFEYLIAEALDVVADLCVKQASSVNPQEPKVGE